MRKLNVIACFLLACFLMPALQSCKNDNDVSPELVSENLPTEGWKTTNTDDTNLVTYRPDDDEAGYYSFKVKGNTCQEAVYNFVCRSESLAKDMEKALRDGSWVNKDLDDYGKSGAFRAMKLAGADATRADGSLTIHIERKGCVIYIRITIFAGKPMDEIKKIVEFWDGVKDRFIPEDFIFGKYDPETGHYECGNTFGIGVNYIVNVTFDDRDFLKSYEAIVKCPNETWCRLLYAMIKDEIEDEIPGVELPADAPVQISDLTLTLRPIVIPGTVNRKKTENFLKVLDVINNCPMFVMITE